MEQLLVASGVVLLPLAGATLGFIEGKGILARSGVSVPTNAEQSAVIGKNTLMGFGVGLILGIGLYFL